MTKILTIEELVEKVFDYHALGCSPSEKFAMRKITNRIREALRKNDARLVAECEKPSICGDRWTQVCGTDCKACKQIHRCQACERTINSHKPPLSEKEIRSAKDG